MKIIPASEYILVESYNENPQSGGLILSSKNYNLYKIKEVGDDENTELLGWIILVDPLSQKIDAGDGCFIISVNSIVAHYEL